MRTVLRQFYGLLLFLAIAAVLSVAVMFIWNALLPDIAGLPIINYWQAAGLFVLIRILFGSIGVHSGIGKGSSFGFIGNKDSLHEKWKNMSEEERNAFVKRHGGDIMHDHNRHGENIYHPHTENNGREPVSEKK